MLLIVTATRRVREHSLTANVLARPKKNGARLAGCGSYLTNFDKTVNLQFSRATISQATATNGLGLANERPFKENKKMFSPKVIFREEKMRQKILN